MSLLYSDKSNLPLQETSSSSHSPFPSSETQPSPPNIHAKPYLQSLLSKTLRITTTDTRIFVGEFKCTDSDRNTILSQTYEYRHPAPPKPLLLAPGAPDQKITLDMTSRYLGLVVVPGAHIVRIELEQFASQVRTGGGAYLRDRGEVGEGSGGEGTAGRVDE